MISPLLAIRLSLSPSQFHTRRDIQSIAEKEVADTPGEEFHFSSTKPRSLLFTPKGLTIGCFPRRRPFWESLVILLVIVFYAFQGSQLGYHGVMLMPKRSLSDLIMMLDCITSINRPGILLYNVDLLKLEPLMKPYQK
ncbi:hypothetical protein RchiOBHm_Chr2g0108471 [Rosa chinensis]|uniref:Uncharacterized protein n=1 Tax=Rosa chinensis TaxID=74649 RepID=A0A2P6RP92_ROSCH|nr:hypothetical protein RchiOBHm_Chr2g0108471 [Rosa chinensis]